MLADYNPTQRPQTWLLFQQEVLLYLKQYNVNVVQRSKLNLTCIFFLKQLAFMQVVLRAQSSKNNQIQFVLETQIDSQKIKHKQIHLIQLINAHNISQLTSNSKISISSSVIKLNCQILQNIFEQRIQHQVRLYFRKHFISKFQSFSEFILNIYKKKSIEINTTSKKKDYKQIIEKIKLIKKLIQKDIGLRENSTIFKNNQITYITTPTKYPNPSLQVGRQTYLNTCLEEYIQSQKRKYKQKQTTQLPKMEYQQKLVRKIDFLQINVDDTWSCQKSGFGSLTKLLAKYKVQGFSINSKTNQFIDTNTSFHKQQSLIYLNYLIQKQPKNYTDVDNGALQCFQTQITMLRYLRNFSSNIVASYYLEQSTTDIQPSSIYLDYYPKDLSQVEGSFRENIKTLRMLAQGLKFFNQIQILHRDLKPKNIMISEKRVVKIIDFGSSWIITKNSYPLMSQQLKTTQAYNLRFQSFTDQTAMTKSEFEQHPLFDVYAFGKILKNMIEKPQNTYNKENIIRLHFNWLQHLCTDQNPNNRVSPQGITFFMKKMHQFFSIFNPQK